MKKQTDQFEEHAIGDELEMRDQADAISDRQFVEDLFIYGVEFIAVVVVIALIYLGY